MPVVQNIVKDTTGAVQNGTVTIELIYFDLSGNPQSFQGFVNVSNDVNADFTMNIPATLAITNGVWSVALQGNAGIASAYGSGITTYYKITETAVNVNRVYYISVPTSGGPYWTGSLGVASPVVAALSGLSLDSLSDVVVGTPTDQQTLAYDVNTGLWSPLTISADIVPITDLKGYWASDNLEGAFEEVGKKFADLTAAPTQRLKELLWQFENADLYFDAGSGHSRSQTDANLLAANQNEISINRNVWSSYIPGMRATNPDLFIWAYMNVGELQSSEAPNSYAGQAGSAAAFLKAYAKDVTGAYITNPNQSGNYLMRPDSSEWLADRVERAINNYIPTTDADGLLLDVIGPGPTKWRGPSAAGSYTGAPCYQDASGNVVSTTLSTGINNSTVSIPLSGAYPASWPSSGVFDIVVKHSTDASVERMTVTGGHGTSALTVATRSQNPVAHASGATVARCYRDSEWMALMATFTGQVKAQVAVPTIGNGLGSGPLYMGQFINANPPEAATEVIIANIDGGVVENFVRDDKTGGSAPVTPRNFTAWQNDLAMLVDAGQSTKPLYLITKSWATGERGDAATQLKWNLYSFGTFLLGYSSGFRFCYIPEHWTSFNQSNYLNPLANVPLGVPLGGYTIQGSGGTSVYVRQFSNGFVAVNPQTTTQSVTLPHSMYPYDGSSQVSGAISMAANTGMIWLDDLTPTVSYLNQDVADTLYDPIKTSGSWTPTVVSVSTAPATWVGSYEQVGTNSYHVQVTGTITGTWSGTATTLTASLPSGWVRHPTQSQLLAGVLTNGTNYYNVVGMIDSLAKSNTSPAIKFLSPNPTTTSFDYRLMTGVGAPISFINGYTLEVSGVIRRG